MQVIRKLLRYTFAITYQNRAKFDKVTRKFNGVTVLHPWCIYTQKFVGNVNIRNCCKWHFTSINRPPNWWNHTDMDSHRVRNVKNAVDLSLTRWIIGNTAVIMIDQPFRYQRHKLFTALHGMQTRSSDEKSVCPSVRLSVRRTRGSWQNEIKIIDLFLSYTGLIPRTLGPFNVFILLNGWIGLHGLLD